MKRRKGRQVMALVLLTFLALASGVVWRKSYGFTEGQRLRELSERRTELDARRTRIEGDIRSILTLRRLGAIVEKNLGLRMPADTQLVWLPRPHADTLP